MSTSAPPSRFDTVLVANRGEIAVRVLRSAAAMGYLTVAVYSDADADAPHVAMADTAVRLGPAAARSSYLDIEAVIAAARSTGAGAIHPGYGFLAENAAFADACAAAGLTFVGPTPDAIRLMGDKAAAKRRMADAGVPLLPGYQGTEQSDATLLAEADAVGLPLMVKAAAGGGGKGMRLVETSADLPEALAAARREALGAFGDDTLILERAVIGPRHVEIQVLADAHGHVIALGERDCSVQRRHQKVVEEAPSPALDAQTRAAMQQAAVDAASAIGYVGAGTVEFLLAPDGMFSFLEMNTRLQVEHPVTELVYGIDLVEWQLRVAAGEHLTVTQDDVRIDGHAIEVRLYAEDPAGGYLPQTGTILDLVLPSGPGVRVDAGVRTGSVVTADYDPMLAKVIAHGRDREEARRRLAAALDRLVCAGVTTNRAFLGRVLRHPVFVAGEATTAFLGDHDVAGATISPLDLATVVGAVHLRRRSVAADRSPELAGWTNAVWLHTTMRLTGDVPEDGVVEDGVVEDGVAEAVITDGPGTACTVVVGERSVLVAPGPDRDRGVTVDGRPTAIAVTTAGDTIHASLAHVDLTLTDVTMRPASAAAAGGVGVLTAPMHGAVTAVPVADGDAVAAGDAVVVMEAMKMEHVIRADVDGVAGELPAVGDQVAMGDIVARITQAADS